MTTYDDAEVHAAGGVVVRRVGDELELLICHRPRYDDWSFPKGKLDPGEDHRSAAVREILEETGLNVELGHELPSAHYRDAKGRSKTVRYWLATVTGGSFRPNDEVDEIRWLPVAPAGAALTYEHDRRLLAVAAVTALSG